MRTYRASLLFVCCINLLLIGCGDASDGGSGDSSTSGSKAKLISMNDDVFTIADGKIMRIDLSNRRQPEITDEYFIGFDIQTLTTDGEVLYVGGETSVSNYRYSESLGFEFISEQQRRIRGRDPVITDGEYAYSTFVTNEWTDVDGNVKGVADLYVYRIEEDKSLTEIGIYTSNEYFQGLALWNNNLLICEPYNGIAQLDVSDPNNLQVVQSLGYAPCEDLIHIGAGHIVTVGAEGIFQLKPIEENKLALISLYK